MDLYWLPEDPIPIIYTFNSLALRDLYDILDQQISM